MDAPGITDGVARDGVAASHGGPYGSDLARPWGLNALKCIEIGLACDEVGIELAGKDTRWSIDVLLALPFRGGRREELVCHVTVLEETIRCLDLRIWRSSLINVARRWT